MTDNRVYEQSDRIRTLKEKSSDNYSRRDVSLRHEIFERVLVNEEGMPAQVLLADALAAFLDEKDICIKEYDLLAGHIQYYDYKDSAPVMIPDDFDPEIYPRGLFDIPREIRNFREKKGASVTDHENHILDEFATGRNTLLFGRWNSGHLICGYERMLNSGLGGLIEEGERSLERQPERDKQDGINAMLTVLRGMQRYILRYAIAAEKLAESATIAEYSRTLRRIADSCRRIAQETPSSFFDAVQLLAITMDVIVCENISGSLSVGRLDQWLFPFYRQDELRGRITYCAAAELIDALWIKCGSLVQGFQNVTLGGCDAEGYFAGNDVTLMCLRASNKIRMDQPLISFRYHPDMPEVFWTEIINLIGSGLGFPAIFNDDVVCRSKINAGVEPEDAWRYGIVGCVEPSIGGDEYSNTEQLRVNWAKILEYMLNNGVCTCTGNRMSLRSPRNLEQIQTFDDFYKWYKEELVHFTTLGMEGCNLLDETYGLEWPAPFLSAVTKACLETGVDITRGAVKYSFSSVNGCGMADAVDSLLAIRDLVYTRKLVSLSEFAQILRSNFEGQEIFRNIVMNLPYRYGNDCDEADIIMRDLTECFVGTVTRMKNIYGHRFQAGLYSVDFHATMGALTGALPNGRLKGVSLANALSPCQGADVLGPTAVICSVTKVDHSKLANGMVLDLKFNPSFLQKEKHREGLRDMIRSYFGMGGMEVQFNVVNRETLLAAQKDPQKYRNLIVRVSGFSAYFNNLDKVLQDEIIARTEYSYA